MMDTDIVTTSDMAEPRARRTVPWVVVTPNGWWAVDDFGDPIAYKAGALPDATTAIYRERLDHIPVMRPAKTRVLRSFARTVSDGAA